MDKTGNVGSGISPADELPVVIVLMKLSQGTTNQDLAYWHVKSYESVSYVDRHFSC